MLGSLRFKVIYAGNIGLSKHLLKSCGPDDVVGFYSLRHNKIGNRSVHCIPNLSKKSLFRRILHWSPASRLLLERVFRNWRPAAHSICSPASSRAAMLCLPELDAVCLVGRGQKSCCLWFLNTYPPRAWLPA